MYDFNVNDYETLEQAQSALAAFFKAKETKAARQQELEDARQDYAEAAAYYFSLAFPGQKMDDVDAIYDAILSLEESSKEFFEQEKKLMKNTKSIQVKIDDKDLPEWLKELKSIANDLEWTKINKK